MYECQLIWRQSRTPSFSDLFLQLTAGAFVFLVTELVVLLLVEHEEDYGWKWRFGEAEDYPELNPFVSTWKIAVFFFAIIVAPVVVSYLFWGPLLSLIASFEFWPLLLIVMVLFSFWWGWHHVVGKEWNLAQALLLILSVLTFVGFVLLNLRSG